MGSISHAQTADSERPKVHSFVRNTVNARRNRKWALVAYTFFLKLGKFEKNSLKPFIFTTSGAPKNHKILKLSTNIPSAIKT
jgi:hypothetical protein